MESLDKSVDGSLLRSKFQVARFEAGAGFRDTMYFGFIG